MRIAWGALVLIACGNGGASVLPDVRLPDAIGASGFVVDRILLPEKTSDASTYAADLDGDGLRDNAFGLNLGVVAQTGSIPLQAMEDDQLAQGLVIELVRVDGATVTTSWGEHPTPQPCVDPQQPTPSTCGRHLQGTGHFDVKSGATPLGSIQGEITNGRYQGAGSALIVVSLFDSAPIPIELAHAQLAIQLDGDHLGPGVLAGGIAQAQLHDVVLPAIAAGMTARLAAECGAGCACPSGSRAAAYASMFDKAPADCAITAGELADSDLLKTLLAPDVILDGAPHLSFGVGLTAVSASF